MKTTRLLSLALLGLFAGSAHADVKLPAVFADHMVLQRDLPTAVWGWAEKGETVQVSLVALPDVKGPTPSGKPVEPGAGFATSAVAGEDGKWTLKLSPAQAGGPFEMVVKGKSNTITVHDVLIGEVWLCSGQSNMGFTVARVDRAAEEIAAANYPLIREFTVAKNPVRKPQTDCKGKWELCSPTTVKNFSAAAYFFGRELHQKLNNVPIGLINSSYGGTDICAWTSEPVQAAQPELKKLLETWAKNDSTYNEDKAKEAYERQMAAWNAAVIRAKADKKELPRRPAAPVRPALSQNHPANLFNGMIAPIIPYTFRGAIWYQGEANTRNEESAKLYAKQLEALIGDWRSQWKSEFPFGVVQLPNISRTGTWALLRDSQSSVAGSLPEVGLAVTIDIGNPKDVHPANKQDVGKRLGAWALHRVYGKADAVPCPLMAGIESRGEQLAVEFKYAGTGLAAKDGGEIKGFMLAGEDGKFVPAKATIDGTRVLVSSPNVPKPLAVQYAWEDNPQVNLVNSAGFPAGPFKAKVK